MQRKLLVAIELFNIAVNSFKLKKFARSKGLFTRNEIQPITDCLALCQW